VSEFGLLIMHVYTGLLECYIPAFWNEYMRRRTLTNTNVHFRFINHPLVDLIGQHDDVIFNAQISNWLQLFCSESLQKSRHQSQAMKSRHQSQAMKQQHTLHIYSAFVVKHLLQCYLIESDFIEMCLRYDINFVMLLNAIKIALTEYFWSSVDLSVN